MSSADGSLAWQAAVSVGTSIVRPAPPGTPGTPGTAKRLTPATKPQLTGLTHGAQEATAQGRGERQPPRRMDGCQHLAVG